MTATTRPTPRASATLARKPKSTNHLAKCSPRVAPEKAPDKTPTKVMPICTVERKRPGSVANARARREPMTWRSTSACNRARREETIASSASASRPLRRISATTIANSMKSINRIIVISNQFRQCQSGYVAWREWKRFLCQVTGATFTNRQAAAENSVPSLAARI
jgi:hypothetical protein